MQAIALEMNLSETAFVYPPDDQGDRRIRWFTPAMEVPLCGHATLASGHVLLASGAVSRIVLRSASGPLTVHAEADGAVRLDFPATPTAPVPPPPRLLDALGIERAEAVETGGEVMIVRVATQADVQRVRPNFTDLGATEVGEVLVLAVTAPADSDDLDFVSRVFAPWAGIDEDPVTGVAHTGLTPYWAARLGRDSHPSDPKATLPAGADNRHDTAQDERQAGVKHQGCRSDNPHQGTLRKTVIVISLSEKFTGR